MEDEKLPRREREKLRQRQDMLAAALELFSEKGYHNVSMHEIAQKAEFAIGTLYKFFKNKEDLYKALMVEQADKFQEALTKAIEEPDDEVEKLRNYVRTKGELFQRQRFHDPSLFCRDPGSELQHQGGPRLRDPRTTWSLS